MGLKECSNSPRAELIHRWRDEEIREGKWQAHQKAKKEEVNGQVAEKAKVVEQVVETSRAQKGQPLEKAVVI